MTKLKSKHQLLRFALTFIIVFQAAFVFAQNINVSGRVQDSKGEPILGVTVTEVGTKNATITDIDGNYNLKNVRSEGSLTFSYVGFETTTIKIGGKTNINIVMNEDMQQLSDVVVVGYATQKKATVAAAVSSINSSDLIRTSSTTTAGALVGKVSGITARQNSGTPGSSATIQIRNMGTPLYVIDGIMKDENAFNTLDINDIENISILKDGAAAIYGVRAANGVVLVTTKRGARGDKPQLNLNTYMGWQSWTKYPKLLNAYEYMRGIYMRAVNDGNLTNAADIANAKAELEKWRTKYYNPETGEDYRGYDWYGNFVDNAAPQFYVNGSVSGGTDKADYYVSLSHVNQNAVFKEYTYNRNNLQANMNMNVTKRLKIGFQVLGKIEQNVNPGLTGADDYYEMRNSILFLVPTQRPYANDNPDYINYISPTHDSAHNMAGYTIDNSGKYDRKLRTVQSTFNLQYDTPLKGLKAKGMFSYYYYNENVDNNEKSYNEYRYNRATDTYDIAYTKASTYRVKTRNDMYELNGQATLNFDRTFAADHHVTAVAGFEFFKQSLNNFSILQSPVDNPFVGTITTNENNNVGDYMRDITTASWIFRAGYSYKEKYIIDFAGRYDASWRFMRGNQWGFFPSVSGAWRLSEEEFYKKSPVSNYVTTIKLRASYGEMGDDMASTFNGLYPDFAYMSGYNYNSGGAIISSSPLNGGANAFVTGSSSRGIAQTTLSWMKVKMFNYGINLGFLRDRLLFEFDMFKRQRTGIPATPTDVIFPYEAGYRAMTRNLNSDQITGYDMSLKWNDKVEDLKYNIGINFTFARQKTLKHYGETFFNAWDKYRYAQTDRWSNVRQDASWMLEVIGVFKNQEQIDNWPIIQTSDNNQSLLPGDVIYKDVNGDGVINTFDYRPKGYSTADYFFNGYDPATSNFRRQPIASMGFTLGCEWRGIDFAADFAGGFLNTWVPDWNVKWGIGSDYNGYDYAVNKSWQHADIFDPTSEWIPGDFPAVRTSIPSAGAWNTFYSKDVNYLRLRNLTIGYTLPRKWTDYCNMQRVRIYFEGTNLLCWDSLNKYGFDPETSSVTGFDYPQHKVIMFGLNITF